MAVRPNVWERNPENEETEEEEMGATIKMQDQNQQLWACDRREAEQLVIEGLTQTN